MPPAPKLPGGVSLSQSSKIVRRIKVGSRSKQVFAENYFLKRPIDSNANSLSIDGWMHCDLRPFQQYFSHIRTMGG